MTFYTILIPLKAIASAIIVSPYSPFEERWCVSRAAAITEIHCLSQGSNYSGKGSFLG